MIKLIASDLDGTLIPEGSPSLHPEFYKTVEKLTDKGYVFAAASGRSYESMKNVLQKVEDDIYFIANNGGMICYKGKVLSQNLIPVETVNEILAYFREQENVFYLLTTSDTEYTEGVDEDMLKWLKEGYKLDVMIHEDLMKLNKPLLKLAIFYKDIDAMEKLPEALERFGDKVSVVVSGAHWIDFVHKESQKGIALERLQRELGISREESMAFGDNNNDISLLQAAEESYAVSNARECVKEVAKYVLPDTTRETVLKVLKTLV